jgi:acetoin utilization deacetylase AcuC-like enzyme
VILVSAGFDGHAQDSLAGMGLVEDDYAAMVSSLLAVQSRLLLVLEGGYHTSALPASVLAVLRVLIDATGPGGPGYRPSGHDAGTAASDEVRRLTRRVQKLHGL